MSDMRMYVTMTFKGAENKADIERLCSLVRKSGFEDFCFIRDVEKYQKTFSDPRELMARSKEEISKCDALLIDMTEKPTGRAIEAGIAFAMGKKIVVIVKKGNLTNIKDTSRGIADVMIEYDKIEDIVPELRKLSH